MRYKLIGVLLIILIISGCYTGPETGRSAFTIVPDAEALSLQQFNQLKRTEERVNDWETNERLQRVGRRIAGLVGNDLPDAEWEFVVFKNDTSINPFAMPGGKVGLYTGMLKLATTDDLLATVIGHEIAHVAARHGS